MLCFCNCQYILRMGHPLSSCSNTLVILRSYKQILNVKNHNGGKYNSYHLNSIDVFYYARTLFAEVGKFPSALWKVLLCHLNERNLVRLHSVPIWFQLWMYPKLKIFVVKCRSFSLFNTCWMENTACSCMFLFISSSYANLFTIWSA